MKLLWRIFVWTFWACVFIFGLGSAAFPNSQILSDGAVTLTIVFLAIPFGIAILVMASFAIVDWIKYGDPMRSIAGNGDYDLRDRGGRRIFFRDRPEEKKSNKKFCPICKRNTRCRIGGGKNGSIPFHIVRD